MLRKFNIICQSLKWIISKSSSNWIWLIASSSIQSITTIISIISISKWFALIVILSYTTNFQTRQIKFTSFVNFEKFECFENRFLLEKMIMMKRSSSSRSFRIIKTSYFFWKSKRLFVNVMLSKRLSLTFSTISFRKIFDFLTRCSIATTFFLNFLIFMFNAS